jgi:hypothetical protein
MYGKMVRTGVYMQWRKANEGDAKVGEFDQYALANAGISRGPVTIPDVEAGRTAARTHNFLINLDKWDKQGL